MSVNTVGPAKNSLFPQAVGGIARNRHVGSEPLAIDQSKTDTKYEYLGTWPGGL
jgi:hypothetical protein